MNANDKHMYHFHDPALYAEIWVPGNSFNIDENFESNIKNITLNHDFLVQGNVSKFAVSKILKHESKTNFEEIPISDIKHLLHDLKKIIVAGEMGIRELALEEYRKDHYPHLPSRFSSLWVSNKKCLKYWNGIFNSEKNYRRDLYELLLNGTLFKTSDEFLPDDGLSYKDVYNSAEKYWNPNFKEIYDPYKIEYLFKGNVRILKKYNDIKEIK